VISPPSWWSSASTRKKDVVMVHASMRKVARDDLFDAAELHAFGVAWMERHGR